MWQWSSAKQGLVRCGRWPCLCSRSQAWRGSFRCSRGWCYATPGGSGRCPPKDAEAPVEEGEDAEDVAAEAAAPAAKHEAEEGGPTKRCVPSASAGASASGRFPALEAHASGLGPVVIRSASAALAARPQRMLCVRDSSLASLQSFECAMCCVMGESVRHRATLRPRGSARSALAARARAVLSAWALGPRGRGEGEARRGQRLAGGGAVANQLAPPVLESCRSFEDEDCLLSQPAQSVLQAQRARGLGVAQRTGGQTGGGRRKQTSAADLLTATPAAGPRAPCACSVVHGFARCDLTSTSRGSRMPPAASRMRLHHARSQARAVLHLQAALRVRCCATH